MADRLIRATTALAVVVVAAVAAIISYRHAFELVRANGETGVTARLVPFTVDGLIWAASMVILDASRRGQPVPALAKWSLGVGILATIGANVAHGLSHGPVGAVVGAWPALALVGSFELAMTLTRKAAPPLPAQVAGAAAGGTEVGPEGRDTGTIVAQAGLPGGTEVEQAAGAAREHLQREGRVAGRGDGTEVEQRRRTPGGTPTVGQMAVPAGPADPAVPVRQGRRGGQGRQAAPWIVSEQDLARQSGPGVERPGTMMAQDRPAGTGMGHPGRQGAGVVEPPVQRAGAGGERPVEQAILADYLASLEGPGRPASRRSLAARHGLDRRRVARILAAAAPQPAAAGPDGDTR